MLLLAAFKGAPPVTCLRFYTSGESHGKGILAFLEGIPAGLNIDISAINAELARRQGGYGRSSRQKLETDEANVSKWHSSRYH